MFNTGSLMTAHSGEYAKRAHLGELQKQNYLEYNGKEPKITSSISTGILRTVSERGNAGLSFCIWYFQFAGC